MKINAFNVHCSERNCAQVLIGPLLRLNKISRGGMAGWLGGSFMMTTMEVLKDIFISWKISSLFNPSLNKILLIKINIWLINLIFFSLKNMAMVLVLLILIKLINIVTLNNKPISQIEKYSFFFEILRQHMVKVLQVHAKFEKRDSTGREKI